MKSQKIQLLIFVLLLPMLASGQGWQRIFQNYGQTGQVVSTPDGGAAFGAVKKIGGQDDLALLKISPDGRLDWEKTLGGTADDQNRSLIQTASGDLVLCGARLDAGQPASALAARFSIFGEKIWEKNWLSGGARAAAAVAEIPSGELFFLLETGGDLQVLKTSSAGDSLASFAVFQTANWQARQIQVSENQEITITLVANPNNPAPPTARLLRLSPTGQFLSEKLLPHLTNYLALATATAKKLSDSSQILVHRDSIYRLDDTLGIIGRERVATPLPLYLTDVLPLANGGFQLVGTHYQFGSPAQNDIFLSRFGVAGAASWERFLPAPDLVHASQKLAAAADGGYFLTGNFPSNAYLMRLDSLGAVATNLLSGSVFWDKNENCQRDTGEPPLRNWLVEVELPDGSGRHFATTDSLGNFKIAVGTGSFVVRPILKNEVWASSCQPSATLNFANFFEQQTVDFAVKNAANCPFPQVSMALEKFSPCQNTPVALRLENLGATPLLAPVVEIKFDSLLEIAGASLPFQLADNRHASFSLPDLPALATLDFWVFLETNCAAPDGRTLCVSARVLPDTACLPVLDLPFLEIEGRCAGDSVHFRVKNRGGAMPQAFDFIVIEDNIMYRQGQVQLGAGADTTLVVEAAGQTLRLEIGQDPALPEWLGARRAAAAVEACGGAAAGGFVNQFSQFDRSIFFEKECREVQAAASPALLKTGFPTGWSAEHFVPQNTDLEYFIQFQNTTGDTVRQVVVRDTLDFSKLAIGSFQLAGASHQHEFWLSGTGVLTVVFPEILLPDSAQNFDASRGWLQFRVAQKPDLPVGTLILNRASVGFDFGAPQPSNQIWHTVNLPLGSAPPPLRPGVQVFDFHPNPAADLLILEAATAENWSFSISDLTGRELAAGSFFGWRHRLSLPPLAAGAYFLTLKSARQSPVSRLFLVAD